MLWPNLLRFLDNMIFGRRLHFDFRWFCTLYHPELLDFICKICKQFLCCTITYFGFTASFEIFPCFVSIDERWIPNDFAINLFDLYLNIWCIVPPLLLTLWLLISSLPDWCFEFHGKIRSKDCKCWLENLYTFVHVHLYKC